MAAHAAAHWAVPSPRLVLQPSRRGHGHGPRALAALPNPGGRSQRMGLRSSAFAPRMPSIARAAVARGRMSSTITAQKIEVTEKWWEKNATDNMIEVNSTTEFLDALAAAEDRLVIVDFYAGWCGACKALYPKLCKLMVQHEEITLLKVNFEDNKPMCKSLGVKVLPFFHFYRGSEGKVAAFSASISRFQRLRDAIAEHNTPRCSIGGPPPPVAGLEDVEEEEGGGAAKDSPQPTAV